MSENKIPKSCPRCDSQKTYPHQMVASVKLGYKRQRYRCTDCGHTFY